MIISPLDSVDSISALSQPLANQGNTIQQSGFSDWFETQIKQTNEKILNADIELRKLATGETDNIHQVMLSLQKAKSSLELTVQLRNKLLEGYQEIMRMQI